MQPTRNNIVTAVYSPVCEANGMFLAKLREWLEGSDYMLDSIPFNELTNRERAWYEELGSTDENGRLSKTVFIDVFHQGKLIDSVPLNRDTIAKALNIKAQGQPVTVVKHRTVLSAANFLEAITTGHVQVRPITRDNLGRELSMCLERYPYGNPPIEYHASCRALKRQVFDATLAVEEQAGVFLESPDGVIGLLEVHPREVLRYFGFATGTEGADDRYLSVGCYEVAAGMPRAEVIDRLMWGLLQHRHQFTRPMLEGIGKVGWSTGFNPYWVYEKYGFQRAGELRPGWFVMEQSLSE